MSRFVGGYSYIEAQQVLILISRYYRVPIDKLLGPRKHRAVARPRMIAMLLMRERGTSLHEIGRVTNRDHSTVVYGIKKAMRAYTIDPDLRTEVDRLRTETQAATATT